jgi:ATP-binding cassette subfamily E protein 1
LIRVAVIDKSACRPKDCGKPCRKSCPVVRTGNEAIYFTDDALPPIIDEAVCIGCGICVKRCPFLAISVVNLPDEIEKEAFHRHGVNGFKLFRFPEVRQGEVTAIVGQNGTGKSTILRILAGETNPNLGDPLGNPSVEEVADRLRGTTTSSLIKGIVNGEVKVIHKPQYVDLIPRAVTGSVREVLSKAAGGGEVDEVARDLQLAGLLDRDVGLLSGGELQRLAIAAAILKDADLYLVDEPSSFLDVSQRISVAKVLRGLRERRKTLVIVEHDLGLLDYLADYVSVVYGEPGVYGVVSHLMSSRVGVNSYLDGYLRTENIRIRKDPIRFATRPPPGEVEAVEALRWERSSVDLDGFRLDVEAGSAYMGQVLGIVGPNGIGKTTFLRKVMSDHFGDASPSVSYKPQYLGGVFSGTVSSVIQASAGTQEIPSWAETEILRPLRINKLLDREVETLSGGELQSLAVASTLIRKSDYYFFDEPCAYLDVEQRMAVQRAIRRIAEAKAAVAFVVEHDILFVDFVSDRLIVLDGVPGVSGHVNAPTSMREGMNKLLSSLSITFRRDVDSGRPRINKPGSRADQEQMASGDYYYVE